MRVVVAEGGAQDVEVAGRADGVDVAERGTGVLLAGGAELAVHVDDVLDARVGRVVGVVREDLVQPGAVDALDRAGALHPARVEPDEVELPGDVGADHAL